MRWTDRSRSADRPSAAPIVTAAALIFICICVVICVGIGVSVVSAGLPEKHLSVYSVAANYSLPLVQREGRSYVGLLELLEPLGRVSAKSDGPRWRLRYNNVDSNFQAGKTRAQVLGRDADLGAKFLLENKRVLVPVASLSS